MFFFFKAIGMQEILKYLMEHSDERFTKQIQYIIDQLNSEKESDELSESNDEDNDVDDMDEDDDVIEVKDHYCYFELICLQFFLNTSLFHHLKSIILYLFYTKIIEENYVNLI